MAKFDDLSPIIATSPSLHNRCFKNVLFIKPKCGTKLNVCEETKELFALNYKESYFEGIIIQSSNVPEKKLFLYPKLQ